MSFSTDRLMKSFSFVFLMRLAMSCSIVPVGVVCANAGAVWIAIAAIWSIVARKLNMIEIYTHYDRNHQYL